jgi:hypothetical protein
MKDKQKLIKMITYWGDQEDRVGKLGMKVNFSGLFFGGGRFLFYFVSFLHCWGLNSTLLGKYSTS